MEASKVGFCVLYKNLEDGLLQSMRRCVIWSNSGTSVRRTKGEGLAQPYSFKASGYAGHPAFLSHFSTT